MATTLSATTSTITSSSATIGGTANPRGSTGVIGLIVSTSANLSISNYQMFFGWGNLTANNIAQPYYATLTGLASGTTYYYQTVFWNSANATYWYGSVLSFTTH